MGNKGHKKKASETLPFTVDSLGVVAQHGLDQLGNAVARFGQAVRLFAEVVLGQQVTAVAPDVVVAARGRPEPATVGLHSAVQFVRR